MAHLLAESAHALEGGAGGREIVLVGGHRFGERNYFTLDRADLAIELLADTWSGGSIGGQNDSGKNRGNAAGKHESPQENTSHTCHYTCRHDKRLGAGPRLSLRAHATRVARSIPIPLFFPVIVHDFAEQRNSGADSVRSAGGGIRSLEGRNETGDREQRVSCFSRRVGIGGIRVRAGSGPAAGRHSFSSDRQAGGRGVRREVSERGWGKADANRSE